MTSWLNSCRRSTVECYGLHIIISVDIWWSTNSVSMTWRNDGIGSVEKQRRLEDSGTEVLTGTDLWKEVSVYLNSYNVAFWHLTNWGVNSDLRIFFLNEWFQRKIWVLKVWKYFFVWEKKWDSKKISVVTDITYAKK